MNRIARASFLVLIVVGAQAFTAPAPAAENEPTFKTKVGVSINATILTGIGLSVGIPLGGNFNARALGNAYSISHDFDSDNGTYTGKVKLLSYGLLVDWHPFDGVFRITAGALDNGNKITLDGKSMNGTVNVGDCTYQSTDPNDPLLTHGQTNFRHVAPYAGFGWGGNMNAAPGFFGTLDLGVMFTGSASISLRASGKAAPAPGQSPQCGSGTVDASTDPNVQTELAKDQADLNDKTNKYKLWPAIGFGLGWRF